MATVSDMKWSYDAADDDDGKNNRTCLKCQISFFACHVCMNAFLATNHRATPMLTAFFKSEWNALTPSAGTYVRSCTFRITSSWSEIIHIFFLADARPRCRGRKILVVQEAGAGACREKQRIKTVISIQSQGPRP